MSTIQQRRIIYLFTYCTEYAFTLVIIHFNIAVLHSLHRKYRRADEKGLANTFWSITPCLILKVFLNMTFWYILYRHCVFKPVHRTFILVEYLRWAIFNDKGKRLSAIHAYKHLLYKALEHTLVVCHGTLAASPKSYKNTLHLHV